MDKLYSKSALILKASCCLLLAPICIILSSLIAINDSFLSIIISFVPIGCLYTIPFWISFKYIKSYKVISVGKYIIFDLIYCYLPAVLGILTSEIFYTVFAEKTIAAGIITLMLAIVFLIESLIFWFLYFVFSKRK